jgi:hypothetical protein
MLKDFSVTGPSGHPVIPARRRYWTPQALDHTIVLAYRTADSSNLAKGPHSITVSCASVLLQAKSPNNPMVERLKLLRDPLLPG